MAGKQVLRGSRSLEATQIQEQKTVLADKKHLDKGCFNLEQVPSCPFNLIIKALPI